jgi:hypothetical protein
VPDLRYHLISLISVFLALAIGILLGVAMADRGVVSDRVQAEITSIQRQLDSQQREIGNQEAQIEDRDAILDRMSEVMIAGSLKGQNVALAAGPYADPEVSRAVQSDLSEAGANITSFKTLPPPEPAELTSPEPTSLESTTPLGADYAGLAREILGFTGEDVEYPETVIFVGGGRIPPDAPPGTRSGLRAAETSMFEVWLGAGVRVIGAEASDSGRTEVPLFREVGIPSVDNADQSAGRAAIIQCATTSCEGSYGTKETATDPFPSPS